MPENLYDVQVADSKGNEYTYGRRFTNADREMQDPHGFVTESRLHARLPGLDVRRAHRGEFEADGIRLVDRTTPTREELAEPPATKAARKLAASSGLSLSSIPFDGDKMTKGDVRDYVKNIA